MPYSKSKIKTLKAKIKKNKKPFKASPFQTLIILSPVIVLIVTAVIALLFIWALKTLEYNESHYAYPKPPKSLTYKKYNKNLYTIPTWKIYTNKDYGFSIKYPGIGYIQDPNCFNKGVCSGKVTLAACGNGITAQNWTRSTNFIQLDNMLGIIVTSYSGTLSEYLASQNINPNNFKDSFVKNLNGASESVYIPKLSTSELTPQVPSITPPVYIAKAGDYIFQFAPLQNPGSKLGCLPPAGSGGNSLSSMLWNIPKSIKFK